MRGQNLHLKFMRLLPFLETIYVAIIKISFMACMLQCTLCTRKNISISFWTWICKRCTASTSEHIWWHHKHYLSTHWGRVTHICVSDITSISSHNGLSPGRHQAIIRTNAGLLLIRPLGTNFSEILIEILIVSLKKMRLKVSSAKKRPFSLGLDMLTHCLY